MQKYDISMNYANKLQKLDELSSLLLQKLDELFRLLLQKLDELSSDDCNDKI